MFTKEQIEKAFEAKKVIKQLEEKEERRESAKEVQEAANTPEAKQREQETKKALLARIEALEDRLRLEEENRNRSFGLGTGNTDLSPHDWHDGLNYEQTLKGMMERGDIVRR